MAVVNIRVKLTPNRRRMARSAYRLLTTIIPNSDAKLYARNATFVPIFPTDNAALTEALGVVITALDEALLAGTF